MIIVKYGVFALAVPILEFQGSVQHIQKGHPTSVTQVILIL